MNRIRELALQLLDGVISEREFRSRVMAQLSTLDDGDTRIMALRLSKVAGGPR